MKFFYSSIRTTSVFLLVLVGIVFTSPVFAAIELWSLDEINERIESLSNEPEGENTELIDVFKELRSVTRQKIASEQKILSVQADIDQLPAQLESVGSKLTDLMKEQPSVDESLDLEGINQGMDEAVASLSAAKLELATLTRAEQERNTRRANIPDDLSQLNLKLIEIGDPSYPNTMTNRLDVANYQLAAAKKDSIKTNIESLKLEQVYNDKVQELTSARKQLLNERIKYYTSYIEVLQPVLQEKSAAAAREIQSKAASQIERFKDIPELRKYAQEMVEYAALKTSLTQQLADVQAFERKASSLLIKTKSQYANAKSRIELIESAGIKIDTETGSLLRLQRVQLGTPEQLRERLENNIKLSTELQLKELKLNAVLANIPLDSEVEAKRLAGIHDLTDQENVEVVEILKQHRSVIQSVNQHYGKITESLRSVNSVTRDLIGVIKEYSFYLDQRLLWIPSAPAISISDAEIDVKSLLHLAETNFPDWLSRLTSDMTKAWPFWLLAIGLLIWILFRKRRYLEVLVNTAERAEKRSCTKFLPTLQSLWVSFLIVLPLPLVFGFLAWRGDIPSSISHGLRYVAFFFSIVGMVKVLVHPRGLLVAHLGLAEDRRKLLEKNIRWVYLAVPALLFTATQLHAESLHPQSGRLVFISMMLINVVFFHLILKPSKGLLVKDESQRVARIVYVLGLLVPIAFIIGECMGYITSIQTVRLQIISTVLLILGTYFFSKFCLRMTLISRRRIAKDQAKKKHKALLAAKEAKAKEADGNEAPQGKAVASIDEIEAEALNIVAVEEQTKRMVHVVMVLVIAFGVWQIWSSSLPALSVLDNVKFGQEQTEQVAQATGISDGDISDTLTGQSQPDQAAEPVVTESAEGGSVDKRTTLKDVLWAVMLAGITLVFAKNLPGLIEMVVLRRLNLQAGGNYAVTTILRYAIVLVGILLVFGQVGVTWSSVQWLAAAVTLGIGFGLQEIFANFVAGIILLFERPFRLGDVVTVGDSSGKVTQISIRATTIKQFNNRELVVPNKDFITGQLINWTLSDSLLRYELFVGIAYGSDTGRATEVMKEIMEKHPKILKDPSTDITFTAFGNSTLDFRLRGYVRSPEDLVEVPSDLHYEIDRRFREEEIEIAFPQTDIHIRTLPESLNVRDFIESRDQK